MSNPRFDLAIKHVLKGNDLHQRLSETTSKVTFMDGPAVVLIMYVHLDERTFTTTYSGSVQGALNLKGFTAALVRAQDFVEAIEFTPSSGA